MKKKIEAGDVFNINSGGSVTVLNYDNYSSVTVKHNDYYGHVAKVQAGHLRRGNIKNPFHPNVYGVGFIGFGDNVATVNRLGTSAYIAWKGMIQRCYDELFHVKNKSYEGCVVHPHWHNFQNFSDWYKNQYKESGWEVDKDILKASNKTYNDIDCCVVPKEINSFIHSLGDQEDGDHVGVSRHKESRGYQSRVRLGGALIHLGTFDSYEKAVSAYLSAKENHIEMLSIKYHGRVHSKVFDALRARNVARV